MPKIKSEDILKPGAVLEVKEIDFNDPEVKALITEHNRQCKILLRMSRFSQKSYDNLKRVVTI